MKLDEIRNQLVYSTAKIVTTDGIKTVTGTGFFVMKEYDNNVQRILLITNNHVIDGYDYAKITLCESDADNNPIDNKHVILELKDLQSICIRHPDPDVDLCALALGNVNDVLKSIGKKAYFKAIGYDFFFKSEMEKTLTAIENVVMIGYPLGMMDEENNKPVVRKGISATNVLLDYNGKKEFMIDMACFPGSSGSPVFLEQTGLKKETNKEAGIRISVDYFYTFLGVVYAVPQMTVKGDIKVMPVPTASRLFSETKGFLNLGYVIKAERVKEIFNEIEQNERNKF